jgi:hypothetical protein
LFGRRRGSILRCKILLQSFGNNQISALLDNEDVVAFGKNHLHIAFLKAPDSFFVGIRLDGGLKGLERG